MPNRNQIIIISVLSLIALLIGYFKNPLNLSMGKRAEVQGPIAPTIVTNITTNLPNNIVTNVITNAAPSKPNPNPVKPNPNPVKPRTISRKDIVGTYEGKAGSNTIRWVFLDNGTIEFYNNGKKDGRKPKWSLVNNQIHLVYNSSSARVYRINPDNSITLIAYVIDGKRTDVPKYEVDKFTFKKIKQPTRTLTLQEKDIVGAYERKSDNTIRGVFLDNGTVEFYNNGNKIEEKKWSLVDNEIHIDWVNNIVYIYRINPDNSLTRIAAINRGERLGYKKEMQQTFTLIKIKQPQPTRTLTLQEKKIVGDYERKVGANIFRMALLDNFTIENYLNGKKLKGYGYKWSKVKNEIHIDYASHSNVPFYTINPDNSLTYIGNIQDGKRKTLQISPYTYIKVTQPSPPRQLTREERKILGIYETKSGVKYRMDFLDNGSTENYVNGKRTWGKLNWRVIGKELRTAEVWYKEHIYTINPDNSLTRTAVIEHGKRKDFTKVQQQRNTYIKIK